MEFLSEYTPSAVKCFGIFFLFSFVILGGIILIALLGRLSHFRRCIRQIFARRTRNARMLADRKKLRADALNLEGVYYFEETEYEADWRSDGYEGAADNRVSDVA